MAGPKSPVRRKSPKSVNFAEPIVSEASIQHSNVDNENELVALTPVNTETIPESTTDSGISSGDISVGSIQEVSEVRSEVLSVVTSNCISPDDLVSQASFQRRHQEPSTTETESTTDSTTESSSSDEPKRKAGDVWMSNGTTFWQNDTGIVSILDKNSGKWILLIPQDSQPGKLKRSSGESSTVTIESDDIPVGCSNSWTNLDMNKVQSVLAKAAGASPFKVASETPTVQDMVNNLNLSFGTGPLGDQPSTSTGLDTYTMAGLWGMPVGKDNTYLLKHYPHALYAHVPSPLREWVWKNLGVELKSLLLDLKSYKGQPTMTLVHDPVTNALQFKESNAAKDIYNWTMWQKAFCTFKALYLMVHPQKEPEITKYKNDIQNFATNYYWSAVTSYNQLFRQYLADFPKCSWAMVDQDLFMTELVPHRLPAQFRGQQPRGSPASGDILRTGVCNMFNRGNCTWGKKCRYDHRCTTCNKFGHTSQVCHGTAKVNVDAHALARAHRSQPRTVQPTDDKN